MQGVKVQYAFAHTQWPKKFAEHIHGHGAYFVDAPVVGSRPQADAGQLIYLVGGDKNSFKKVHKVLSASATAIHHTGKTGSGMSLKLAINGLFGIQVAALGEILGMLNKSGFSKESTVNLLNDLPITCPAMKGIGLAIASDNFDPLFPIDLVEKDLGYLQQLSRSQGAEIPLVNKVKNIYQQAIKSGYGNNNIAAVSQLYL